MRVYQPWSADGYQWVIPDERYRTIRKVLDAELGKPVDGRWRATRVRLLTEEEGQQLRCADMPWYSGYALAVTGRARDVLEEVVGADAEFLSLECDDQQLWLLHPWRVVDALDEEQSEVARFDDGRVMDVTRYVFRDAVVRGLICFRIPQRLGLMFVTDGVLTAVRDAGLTGVDFRRVWQSSSPP